MGITKIDHGRKYEFADSIVLAAGKTIKLESTPDGEEYIRETVPEGKSWTISIGVKILENGE